MSIEIKRELINISIALSDPDELYAGYAFSFMIILSKYPLFIPGYISSDSETEVKYVDMMNGAELWLNGKINPGAKEKIDELVTQLSAFSSSSQKHFKRLIIEFRYGQYQLSIVSDLRKLYKFIKKCRNSAGTETEITTKKNNIAEFDKYMFNLLAAGPVAVSSIDFQGAKIPKFISEKYYYTSVSDPKFNIVKFLINGPHTILYAYGCIEFVELVCELIAYWDGLSLPDEFLIFHSVRKLIFKMYGLKRTYNHDLKIIFPEGATGLEYLTIPY